MAAGINGSCRYRFGGIRDFLIGACIVDGEGRILQAGGKVVKNAAGFLLHQAMVGSCGTLGVLAELTFKVFPAAEAHATVRVEAGDLDAALAVMAAVQRERFDLEAIDITSPGTVWLRLGGFAEALADACGRAAARRGHARDRPDRRKTTRPCGAMRASSAGSHLAQRWCACRSPGRACARSMRPWLAATAERRYSVAGNLAWVSWPEPVETLDAILRDLDLVGQVVIGPPGRPFIGAVEPNAFEERLRGVMDPHGRFLSGS